MRVIVIIALCFLGYVARGQNFRADFMEVYKNYNTVKYYEQEVSIRSFRKNGDKKAAYEDKGKIVKNRDKYYSYLGGQTTIIDGANFLHVDKNEKQMIYYHKKTNHDVLRNHYADLLDSMKTADVQYLGEKNGMRKYLIKSEDYVITKTELTLDMRKKAIAELVYYYAKDENHKSEFYKTVITYKTTASTPPSPSWFNMKKYIVIDDNNKVRLQTSYQDYTLAQPREKKLGAEEMPTSY